MEVSIRVLKDQLSKYVRQARGGRLVVVTDRGRPVAELRAISEGRLDPAARLERLAEGGEVTLPQGALADFRPARHRGKPLSETLLADRE